MSKYCKLLWSVVVLSEILYCFAENVELFVEKLHFFSSENVFILQQPA